MPPRFSHLCRSVCWSRFFISYQLSVYSYSVYSYLLFRNQLATTMHIIHIVGANPIRQRGCALYIHLVYHKTRDNGEHGDYLPASGISVLDAVSTLSSISRVSVELDSRHVGCVELLGDCAGTGTEYRREAGRKLLLPCESVLSLG